MSDDSTEQTVGDELEQFEEDFTETLSGEPLEEDVPEDADQVVDSDDIEPEPTDDEPEVDATLDESPEPEPETAPEPKLVTLPNDEKFGELAGQKVTSAQIEEAGLLDTLVTWGHQGLVFQQKFSDVEKDVNDWRAFKEKMKAAEEQAASKPEPEKELTPEEILQMSTAIEANYMPLYEKAAKAGAVEPELLEFAPKFVTGLEHRLQAGQKQIDVLTDAVLTFAEDFVGRSEGAKRNSGRDHLLGLMDEVSALDGLTFLSDDGSREKFSEWFATDANGRGYETMDTGAVTAGLMEDAAWAFIRSNPEVLAAVAAEATTERKRPAANRKLASGGGNSRGATTPAGNVASSELDKFEQEYDETSNQRY